MYLVSFYAGHSCKSDVCLCLQSHKTHSILIVYYLATNFNPSIGHLQATVEEHECIQKLSTIR